MVESIIEIVGILLHSLLIIVYGLYMYRRGVKAGVNGAVIKVLTDNEIIEKIKEA